MLIRAIKKAETDDALIVRVYNASDEEVTGEIRVFQEMKSVGLTNLNEELLEPIPLHSEHTIALQARPWEVKTVKIEF